MPSLRTAIHYEGDDPRLRIAGDRCVRGDGSCTFDFQTSLELCLTGSGECTLSVDLTAGGNGFDLLVDGQLHSMLETHRQWRRRRTYSFVLPPLPSDTRCISLVKRTEPVAVQLLPYCRVRAATLHGVDLSEGHALVDHTPPRRIEFVGDSNLAAFGVLGAPSTIGVRGLFGLGLSQQSIRHSWAHMLCRMCVAEPCVIGWSGVGVVQNAIGTGGKHRIAEIYERCLGNDGSRFDFATAAWSPQIVCVDVGANDVYGGRAPPSEAAFVDAYVALLQLIRRHRPQPCLMLCIVPRLDTPVYLAAGYRADDDGGMMQSYLRSAVDAYERASGDQLVRLVSIAGVFAWPADGGSLEHWGVRAHEKYADAVHAVVERLPVDWV